MSNKKVEAPYRTWKTREYTPSPELRRAWERASEVQPPLKTIHNRTPGPTAKPKDEGE